MAQSDTDPRLIEDTVVVVGQRPRGSTFGDIEPVYTYDALEVRSLGANNIAEILVELAPQVSTGGRRAGTPPTVLINGRRASGLRELRNYPSEAVTRIEILPEEVSLKYGFKAGQRVVNIVLRERFLATTATLGVEAPTEGGRVSGDASGNRLRILDNNRFSLDLEVSASDKLRESDRSIISNNFASDGTLGLITSTIPNGEIDPALSSLFGQAIIRAEALPSAASAPVALTDFSPDITGDQSGSELRTLLPSEESVSLAASFTDALLDTMSFTAAASVDYSQQEALLGLATARSTLPSSSPFSPFSDDVIFLRAFDEIGPSTRNVRNWDGAASIFVNGPPSAWSWSANAQYDYAKQTIDTETRVATTLFEADVLNGAVNPFGALDTTSYGVNRETAQTETHIARVEGFAYGELAELPAGSMSLAGKTGASVRRLDTFSNSGGMVAESDFGRETADAQVNIDLPLLSREMTGSPIGDLSIGANGRVDHLSDFGDVVTYGLTGNARPFDGLQITASTTFEETAPTLMEVGAPVSRTPNLRVFDFATGQTSNDVTLITGGADDLAKGRDRTFRVSATYTPEFLEDFTLSGTFTDQRIEDSIENFPTLTADVEAAFGDRITRDATGTLIEIDARPVNFHEVAVKQVNYGILWSIPLPGARPDLDDQQRMEMLDILTARAPEDVQRRINEMRAAGGGPGAAGGAGMRRPQGLGGLGGGLGGGQNPFDGSLQIALDHTITLNNSVVFNEGGPRFDLLQGEGVGGGGDVREHQVSGRVTYSKQGVTARASVNWQSESVISGGADGDLIFDDFARVDFRLTLDPGRRPNLLLEYPILRGARITLDITNVFDAQRNVENENGLTPIGYQPYILDPQGRTVSVTFRKLLF